jgi:microcystin-dependent protein
MATVTGYTSQRMKIIEDTTVVDGEVRTDNLILVTRAGTEIDAGSVRGPQGIKGDTGEVSQAELDAALATVIAAMFKPGMLMMFGGGTLPADWLKCDGAAIDRATYAPLFSAIGVNYGIGDGSTTFNLPNFSIKFPVGAGNAPYNTLGTTGGEDKHKLITGELPVHNHDVSHDHGIGIAGANSRHTHGYNGIAYVGGTGGWNLPAGGGFAYADQILSGDSPDHSHTVDVYPYNASSGAAGSDGFHNNMPPYVVVNYMIHI